MYPVAVLPNPDPYVPANGPKPDCVGPKFVIPLATLGLEQMRNLPPPQETQRTLHSDHAVLVRSAPESCMDQVASDHLRMPPPHAQSLH